MLGWLVGCGEIDGVTGGLLLGSPDGSLAGSLVGNLEGGIDGAGIGVVSPVEY